jgi:taurine dioxygenase
MRSPRIIASGAACGAEVTGVDLSEPDAQTIAALREALAAHLVVVVRGQSLDAARLRVLGEAFGPLEAQGVSVLATQDPAVREAHLVVSNRMALARPTGSLGAPAIWQSDLAYRMKPCSIALLHAAAAAPGARAVFANQQQAFDTLPAALRARIEKRLLLQDESVDGEGRLREGFPEVHDPRESTGAQHPLVCSHSESRRHALFLGRRRNSYVIGLPLPESEALLDSLWTHATQPVLIWAHDWRSGDTLLWDNRCLLHRHDAGVAESQSLMLRVQVRGERPR